MLILMFFFHFWVVVDGKIHCQAQQRFFLNLYLILTCLMSPHDNWHFPIIMWKGGLEWKKSLKFNKILTTDYKKSIFLKMCPKFDGLEAFSWFVPFFENLRHHVGTPTRWCPKNENCVFLIFFRTFSTFPMVLASRKKNSPVHRSSNLEKNIGVPFMIWSKIMWGQKWNIL